MAEVTGSWISVTNLRTEFNDQWDESFSDVSARLFRSWCNRLNYRCYERLYQLNPNIYKLTQTISVAISTVDYSLNSDFRTIKAWNCWLFKTNADWTITDQWIDLRHPWKSELGFTIWWSTLTLTKTPQSTATYILVYMPELEEIDDDSDQMLLWANKWKDIDLLLDWLDVEFQKWDKNLALEVAADQRFARWLKTLKVRHQQTDTQIDIDYDIF